MKRTLEHMAVAILAAGTLAFAALGCERQGQMEKAGEKIDEAVDEITHPNEGPLEEAGRKVDETVEDLKEKAD